MRTAQVARQLGISADWLRRLERAGRIPPVRRDLNGHRRYKPEDLAKLAARLFEPDRRKGRNDEG